MTRPRLTLRHCAYPPPRTAEAGLKPTGIAWEVYVSDPAETAEADLVTEVYMQLA